MDGRPARRCLARREGPGYAPSASGCSASASPRKVVIRAPQRPLPCSLPCSSCWRWRRPRPPRRKAPGLPFPCGLFDIGQSEKATEGGLEYRLEKVRVFRLAITPAFGISANEDGAFWGFAGFRTDFPLGEKWLVIPNFAGLALRRGSKQRPRPHHRVPLRHRDRPPDRPGPPRPRALPPLERQPLRPQPGRRIA